MTTEEKADRTDQLRSDESYRFTSGLFSNAVDVCLITDVPTRVPPSPGLYAIFIDKVECLSPEFVNDCKNRLLYIGLATRSLNERLVRQDLQHHCPSSFFRSLGAILGYRPPRGSLLIKRNKNNYRFSDADEKAIRNWIDQHLAVSWICRQHDLQEEEAELIERYLPLLNIMHHPSPLNELKKLRAECRAIAMEKGTVA